MIKLYFPIKIAEVVSLYDQIEVHRSTSASGVYTEITAAGTRIELQRGVSLYTHFDDAGTRTNWYKSRFRNSKTAALSGFSDPVLGDEAEELSGIMTVEDLKAIYLFGVDLTDGKGNTFPDIMFDFAIRAAISWFETQLAMDLRPTLQDEYLDYDYRRFQNWGIVQLSRYPVITFTELSLNFPSLGTPYVFPADWIRLDAADGRLNIVPVSGSLYLGMALQPYLSVQGGYVPRGIRAQYTSGFVTGTVPDDIRAMIGRKASFPILNTAGDLIAGAGIASTSIGIDGLSQSVNTTSSATNSGYGARLIQYSKEIKEEMPRLKMIYKNVGLAVA